jgi:hypothetical protein
MKRIMAKVKQVSKAGPFFTQDESIEIRKVLADDLKHLNVKTRIIKDNPNEYYIEVHHSMRVRENSSHLQIGRGRG